MNNFSYANLKDLIYFVPLILKGPMAKSVLLKFENAIWALNSAGIGETSLLIDLEDSWIPTVVYPILKNAGNLMTPLLNKRGYSIELVGTSWNDQVNVVVSWKQRVDRSLSRELRTACYEYLQELGMGWVAAKPDIRQAVLAEKKMIGEGLVVYSQRTVFSGDTMWVLKARALEMKLNVEAGKKGDFLYLVGREGDVRSLVRSFSEFLGSRGKRKSPG